MAGSYPDAPGRRMAWDADGTVLAMRNFQNQPGPFVEYDAATRAELNDEDNTQVSVVKGNGDKHIVFIFPELREIDGFYACTASSDGATSLKGIEVSDDTTNGIDGTWTTALADFTDPPTGSTYNTYRTHIASLAANAQRALRLIKGAHGIGGSSTDMQALHVYGTISPGETPDRLLWLDNATGLEFTAPLDLGDVPRGGSSDHEIRLRNNSASYTIETIQYTAEALYLAAGAWWTFTLPGGATFQATRQIASLAPSTTTGIITARRITPATEDLGLHAPRFRAVHTALT